MTMMRIDSEEALLKVSDALRRHNKPVGGISSREACELILEAVRPKGEWIRETEEDLKDKYICSICGRRVDEVDDYLLLDEDNRVSDVYPYCHCGARME